MLNAASVKFLFFFFGFIFLYFLNIHWVKMKFHLHFEAEQKKNWAPQLDLANSSFDQIECWLCVYVCVHTICTTREKYWPERVSFHCISVLFIQIQALFSRHFLRLSSGVFSVVFVVAAAAAIVVVGLVVSRKSLVKFA